jgi:hypothetical protein
MLARINAGTRPQQTISLGAQLTSSLKKNTYFASGVNRFFHFMKPTPVEN